MVTCLRYNYRQNPIKTNSVNQEGLCIKQSSNTFISQYIVHHNSDLV